MGTRNIFLVNVFYSLIFFTASASFSKDKMTTTMEASPNIMSLLETERFLIRYFKQYTQKMEEHIAEMKEYVDSLDVIYNAKTRDYNEYLSHPVNSFLLMRRLTLDVEDISGKMKIPEKYLKLIDLTRTLSNLPKDGGFDQTVAGFISLQTTYGFESSALSRGKLHSRLFRSIPEGKSEPLTGADCHLLAKAYLANQNEEKYLEWYELGKIILEEEENFEELFIEEPDENDSNDPMVENVPYVLSGNIDDMRMNQNEIYSRLCRGEKIRPLAWEKDLRCEYFAGHDAYYLLQPVKIEIVSSDPFLAQFYNVINDNEIEAIKEMGTGQLSQALVAMEDGTLFPTKERISFNSWIKSNTNKVTRNIDRKMEMLLGLRIDETEGCSEQLQLNNYGTGGLYSPHYDYFIPEYEKVYQLEENGNRIATFMYYASDVPAGGATVFPLIGATVWPKKGSAVFWWNLKSNGERDELTYHGGCPVIYGSKWVINKWIRSHCQISVKKCDLKPNSFFTDV